MGDFFAAEFAEQARKSYIDLFVGAFFNLLPAFKETTAAGKESVEMVTYAGDPKTLPDLVQTVKSVVTRSLEKLAKSLVSDGAKYLTKEGIKKAIYPAAENQDMLQDSFAPIVINYINYYQGELQREKNQLLYEIQNIAAFDINLYAEDLNRRKEANELLLQEFTKDLQILQIARDERDTPGSGYVNDFIWKNGIKQIFSNIVRGGSVYLSLLFFNEETWSNIARLDDDGRLYEMATSTMFKAIDTSETIYYNTYRGLNNIRTETAPVFAQGEITAANHRVIFDTNYFQHKGNLLEAEDHLVRNSYTELSVANNSTAATVYEVIAKWQKGNMGFMEKQLLPSLAPGQSGTIRINYKQDGYGEFPVNGTEVEFYLLGTIDSGTYLVGQLSDTFAIDSGTYSPFTVETLSESSAGKVYSFPLSTRIENSVMSSGYELNVFVENIFETTVEIMITQAIPGGVTITDPGEAVVDGGLLVYTHVLEPEETALLQVEFTCSLEPGTNVEFPGTIVLLEDLTGENSVEFYADPIVFLQRFPLLAAGDPPVQASSGEDISLPITITNLHGESTLEGTLLVQLKDEDSHVLYGQNLVLAPAENWEEELVFSLVADPGSYEIRGVWQANNTEMVIFSETILVDVGHLAGTVKLQGRHNHGGVVVSLDGYTTTTNASGSFALHLVEQGHYVLAVAHPEYLAATEGVYVETGKVKVVEIDLALAYQPPVAMFNMASIDPLSPYARSFSALPSSSPDDEIVEYQWYFGDGNTGLGEEVTHQYDYSGIHEVTLTVSDSRGLQDTMVQEIHVGEGFKLIVPGELEAVIFEDESVSLAENAQNVPRQVLIRDVDGKPVTRFIVGFDQAMGDIDFSQLVAAVDTVDNKAIVYMQAWPQEAAETRYLYIPSSGAGRVYICTEAVSLEEVSAENPDRVIIAAGETVAGMTVETVTIGGMEFYEVKYISGGGGEWAGVEDECFIATAAFGSKLDRGVVVLRQFRDAMLLTNRPGQAMVSFYYRVSPSMAAHIKSSPSLRAFIRVVLLPVIAAAYMFLHYELLLLIMLAFTFIYFRRRFRKSLISSLQ